MTRSLVPHRVRSRAALAAVGVLTLGALSACGFDYATDQIYNASVGTNHRTGPVDVLSAVVVSSSDGQGTFIATFNNNSTTTSDTVTSLAGGSSDTSLQISGFSPLDLAPGAFLNIADSEQIKVTGDFMAGQYVDLVMDLQNADTIEMSVPVVAATDEYADLDTTASESPAAVPSTSPSASPSTSVSGTPAEVPTATTATAAASGSPAQ